MDGCSVTFPFHPFPIEKNTSILMFHIKVPLCISAFYKRQTFQHLLCSAHLMVIGWSANRQLRSSNPPSQWNILQLFNIKILYIQNFCREEWQFSLAMSDLHRFLAIGWWQFSDLTQKKYRPFPAIASQYPPPSSMALSNWAQWGGAIYLGAFIRKLSVDLHSVFFHR